MHSSSDDYDDGIVSVFDITKEINYNIKYKDIIGQSLNSSDAYVCYIAAQKL